VTNDLKLKIYPAVIAILGLGLVALFMSRVEIQVARQSPLDAAPDQPLERPSDSPTDSLNPAPSPEISPSPLPIPIPSTAPVTVSLPADLANSQGGLRVSNQTIYPVRVALLYQQSTATTTQSDPKPPHFEQPVHWDFAPEEGGTNGLILSLPSGGLRLRSGDVLVAFAQDGSRRYWGPYVVGKTELPSWSSEQNEWLLPLQP